MSKTRPALKKPISPLALFFAKEEIRTTIAENIKKSTITLGRAVFNNYPDNPDNYNPNYLQSLFELHMRNISRIRQANNSINFNDEATQISAADFTGTKSPDIDAWVNLAFIKAILDIFDSNNEVRPEIRDALKGFSLENAYPKEELGMGLFGGYLMHMGACIVGKCDHFYDLKVVHALQQKMMYFEREKKSIVEIKEIICSELCDALDKDEIALPEMKQKMMAALLSVFTSEYQEAHEAYDNADRQLNAQLFNEANDTNPNWDILFEIRKIYEEIDWSEDTKEQLEKIKLLTQALDMTANNQTHTPAYSDLIREISEHAWGKRLASYMTSTACLASIAACVTLAVLISGPAIPFVVAGLGVLAVGALITSSILFWQGYKNKAIEDAMKTVRDEPILLDDNTPKLK